MTGARDGRSDGSKQQGSGPALFPRLHVAETKRAGPRGPPRNKMALFEQLTIPSHKFKPSPMALPSSGRTMKSPAMTTPIYLPIPQVSAGSHDSMYSYVPMNYMNPTMMPTMACIPSYSYSGLFSAEATHSMNTSGSKSTVMDGAEESPFIGGAVPKTFSHSKFQAPSKQGRGDDDFAVPTYSSATQSSGQTTRPSSPLRFQKAPRGQRPSPKAKGPVIQKWSPLIQNKFMEVTSSESKDNGGWSTASGECVSVCVTGNEGDSQENGHSELERVPSSENYPATAPTDKVCRADSLNGPSEQDMHSNVFSENQSWEDSEPSRQGRASSPDSGSSMLENAPAGSVQFQDVVNAFGQREFWKTQMILIRQQRIFSRQVFQLHRAIEVQQLLAKALCSSTSIDEALEKEDDNVHMAESPVAEVPEVPEAESPVAEVPEVPLVAEAPPVPEVAERHPETEASNENSRAYLEPPHQPVHPLPVHTQQAFNREAPWPAPPYAPNPWAVRMASSFMYVPYPGPYPPGYGAYPMMGAPMPMYAPPGALQQQPVRFPTWQQQQQSGMPLVMGAQDPTAMAAWYGQQVLAGVPAAAMVPSTGIAPPACHLERLTPSGSGQSVESTSHIAGARQAGQAGAPFDACQAGQAGAPFDARQSGQAGALFDARQAGQAGSPFDARQAGQAGALFDARQSGAPFDARQAGQAGQAGAPFDSRLSGSPFDARQAGQAGAPFDSRQSGSAFDARQADRDGTLLDARQTGQDGENSNKGSTGDTLGWAKGWGRKEGRWVRGDRSLVHKKAIDIANLRGKEANCQNGDTAREGGDLGHGGFQPMNDCYPIVEPEANLEGRQEGMTSLKHMRLEGAFESGACRWFPILSPSKRPMHHNGVIKVVPRAVSATPELAANILLSIQTDRRQ